MQTIRHVFACLVHESADCVIDLVRNLRTLDPGSLILLYNGGRDPNLLTGHFPFERHGAVLHPSPRPVEWGHLHYFALDCMAWACDNYPLDTLTIVDSDQLAIRPGYSDYLGAHLKTMARVGVLGNLSAVHAPGTRIGPAEAGPGAEDESYLRTAVCGLLVWLSTRPIATYGDAEGVAGNPRGQLLDFRCRLAHLL